MSRAVIVAAVRSPIGRAFKGSLVQLRPDDMSAQVLSALLAKVPQVAGSDVEDVIWGCASPAGEQGYNVARVTALLCGLTEVPGTTVNRYCASSLQAIRMAAHAIAAGEGDIYVAGGVESVSRFANGFADEMPGTHNPRFEEAEQRTAGPRPGRFADLGSRSRVARHLHCDGPDGRERTRADAAFPVRPWTASPSDLSSGPSTSQDNGFFQPGDRPAHFPGRHSGRS